MQRFSELQAIKPSSPLPCSHCKVLAFQEEEEQRAVVGRSRRTGTGRPFQAVQYASIHQTAPRDGPFSYDPASFPQQKIPWADHQLSTGTRSRIEVMPGARSLQCRVFCFPLNSFGFSLSGGLPWDLHGGLSVCFPAHS